jgi:hypothetical protein
MDIICTMANPEEFLNALFLVHKIGLTNNRIASPLNDVVRAHARACGIDEESLLRKWRAKTEKSLSPMADATPDPSATPLLTEVAQAVAAQGRKKSSE